jgi:hypothetical protein
MAQTFRAADHPGKRRYSIGERLLRLGLRSGEALPPEPAALEAVLAFRGLTSFIGMPILTFVPDVADDWDDTDASASPATAEPAPRCPVHEEAPSAF